MSRFLKGAVIFASVVTFCIFGWCLWGIIQFGWELEDFFSLLLSGTVSGVLGWCGWYIVNHSSPPVPVNVVPWQNIVALVLMSSAVTAVAYNVKPIIRELNISSSNRLAVDISNNETQVSLSKEESKRTRYRAKTGGMLPLSPEIRQLQPTTGTVTTNNQKVFERTIPPDYLLSVVGKGLRVIKDDAVEKNYIPYDKEKCWPQGWVEYSVPVTSHVWYVACTPT